MRAYRHVAEATLLFCFSEIDEVLVCFFYAGTGRDASVLQREGCVRARYHTWP